MSDPADTNPPRPGGSSEEQAWAEVLARWGDEGAHAAYLRRFNDLEGMAVAGGRYRAVLAQRPDDPVALRMRDEVVRKATVVGLATLPRTAPPRTRSVPRWVVVVLATSLGSALVWVVYKLVVLLGATS